MGPFKDGWTKDDVEVVVVRGDPQRTTLRPYYRDDGPA